jgi:hypothetical protein
MNEILVGGGMPKAFRAGLVELFDGHNRPGGYVYALTEENVRSRVKRLHERHGSAWSTVIESGPEEVEVSEELYKTLSRDRTTSIWSSYGKSKGDLTIIA